MNYCSNCGSPQISWRVPPGDNRLRQVCGACGTVHYHNPKIIAGCLPMWEDKVLLCRRAIEPRQGLWNVPAGFLEIGESVEAGAIREVQEEAEAQVHQLRLHTIFTFTNFHHVYIQFLGELVDGQFGVGEETLESRLFSEEEIPWDEIAFASSVFALQRFFEDRKSGVPQVHVGSI
ncbi:MAG: NUDIX hydrolase [Bacteroidetes bacterium]|nr:NUDIX hydrolase [Bacteroidota bacterium]